MYEILHQYTPDAAQNVHLLKQQTAHPKWTVGGIKKCAAHN